jgi:hypothetical protein
MQFPLIIVYKIGNIQFYIRKVFDFMLNERARYLKYLALFNSF